MIPWRGAEYVTALPLINRLIVPDTVNKAQGQLQKECGTRFTNHSLLAEE